MTDVRVGSAPPESRGTVGWPHGLTADAAAVVRLRDAAAEWLLARGIEQWHPGEATEVGRRTFTPDRDWPPVTLFEKLLPQGGP